MSAFEATQAYGTAQLTALKLLVKSVCVLAALTAVGVSAWISLSILGDEVFIQMWNVPLSSQLRPIKGALAALTGYEQLALAIVAAIGVVVWVAAFAVLGALWTRYSRRMNIAASLLLLYGLALALLAPAKPHGIASEFVVAALFGVTRWVAAAALTLAIVYLVWSGRAERLVTFGYVCVALLVSAVFGAAWLTTLRAAGVSLAGMPATNVVWMLSPILMPLMASVLAPLSLSRIRHT